MTTAKEIATNIRFMKDLPDGVLAYTINGAAVIDRWKKIAVLFNGGAKVKSMSLPAGKWVAAISNNQFITKTFAGGGIVLAPYSCSVFYPGK